MQETHDPFSYLLSEIAAFDAGLRDWDDWQRNHYLDHLLVEEAQEIAWGRRHLTVVHGEPADEVEARLLRELVAVWIEIVADCDWSRVGAVPGLQVTLSAAGAGTDDRLARCAGIAARSNPGTWLVVGQASHLHQ